MSKRVTKKIIRGARKSARRNPAVALVLLLLVVLLVGGLFLAAKMGWVDLSALTGGSGAKQTETNPSQGGTETGPGGTVTSFSMDDIPPYTTEAYVVINDNMPSFTDGEKKTEAVEEYTVLDSLVFCNI